MYNFEFEGATYEFTPEGIALVAEIVSLHRRGVSYEELEQRYGWEDTPGIVEFMVNVAATTGMVKTIEELS